MKTDYWNEFMQTGRVEDYLCYRSAVDSQERAETYTEQAGVEKRERNDNRDRDGAFGSADRRI